MSEGFWVIFGVILGFVGTYLLQKLAENRRKKQLRTVARNIIGIEIIYNLETIGHIEKLTMQTIDTAGQIYVSNLPPRSEVFGRFLDLPSLSVLDYEEQGFFTLVLSQLNLVTRDFALWPDRIRQEPFDDRKLKEKASKPLLTNIPILRLNLVQLLCEICSREREGLQDKQLRNIYHKTKGYSPSESLRAGKTSDYKKSKQKEEDQYKYLIVWEHDWPKCPLKVIELKPIKEE